MHELHETIRPQLEANGTRTLRGPHLTAFIEDWLTGRARKTSADAVPVDTTETHDSHPQRLAA
jgi:hypothetical protein